MLGAALERGREPQHLLLGQIAQGHHVGHPEPPLGEGARLVEDHRLQIARPLERRPVADEETVLGRELGADRHHQRHREPEGVRAGDDHHRDHPLERPFEGIAQGQPAHEGDGAAPEGDPGQPVGGAVGDVLGPGAGLLGLAYHLDDLGEVGLVAGLADLDDHRPLAVDGTTDDLVALLLVDRLGFAGQHRFVEARAALDDDAVDGDLLAGTDQHPITGPQLGDRHLHGAAVRQQLGGRGGQELDERFEGARRAHHRPHLDPVTEQHDVDEGDELPEEDLARQPEGDGRRVEEGGPDREADQGHHPRLTLPEFAREAGQERPGAVEEDHRRKGEQDVEGTGEGERLLEPQDPLHERRKSQHRHREHQGHPEAAPEIGDHRRMVVTRVAVAGVSGGPAVARAVTGMGAVPVMRMGVAGPMPGPSFLTLPRRAATFVRHCRDLHVLERRPALSSMIEYAREPCFPRSSAASPDGSAPRTVTVRRTRRPAAGRPRAIPASAEDARGRRGPFRYETGRADGGSVRTCRPRPRLAGEGGCGGERRATGCGMGGALGDELEKGLPAFAVRPDRVDFRRTGDGNVGTAGSRGEGEEQERDQDEEKRQSPRRTAVPSVPLAPVRNAHRLPSTAGPRHCGSLRYRDRA